MWEYRNSIDWFEQLTAKKTHAHPPQDENEKNRTGERSKTIHKTKVTSKMQKVDKNMH